MPVIGRPDCVTGRIDWLEFGVESWCDEFKLVLKDVPGLAICEIEFSSIIDSFNQWNCNKREA